jgi:hypothetical protein
MTAAAFVLSALTRIERLFDALAHPARRERAMLVVLACYFAIWSLYAAISRSSQDIQLVARGRARRNIRRSVRGWCGPGSAYFHARTGPVCPETEAFCMRALHGYAAYYGVEENIEVRAAFSASPRRQSATRSSSSRRTLRSVFTAPLRWDVDLAFTLELYC